MSKRELKCLSSQNYMLHIFITSCLRILLFKVCCIFVSVLYRVISTFYVHDNAS